VIARIYTADEARELRRVAQGPFESSLCDSVEHHAARADAAEQECARLRAMVAELESLATGPRGLVVDDAACAAIDGTASIGPQGVDATEREVLP